ncbi:MAG: cation transporter [Magnetococcales bacterium]|nr:cation transporter [Magnetococcales bacterium]
MSHEALDAKDAHYAEAKLVTQVGTGGDLVLTIAKLGIGYLSNSAALVAEGFHSGADLAFDLVVLVGMKIARKAPDEGHPYGHGKFEGLTSILLAVILLAVAVGIVNDAAGRLTSDELHPPGPLAFWVALFSIVAKEALFQYTIRTGTRLKSNIIIANAWHHRADSISSGAALVGIGGALMGWPIFDPLAAIAVAFFVSKVSFEIGSEAIKELTDNMESVDAEAHAQMVEIIKNHPEVLGTHTLRARRLGPDIVADVHLEVDPFLSVSEGHQIAAEVRSELLQTVGALSELIVHVDVENDWIDPYERLKGRAPTRRTMKEALTAQLASFPELSAVWDLIPHYSAQGIIADLILEAPPEVDQADFRQASDALARWFLGAGFSVTQVRCHRHSGVVVAALP